MDDDKLQAALERTRAVAESALANAEAAGAESGDGKGNKFRSTGILESIGKLRNSLEGIESAAIQVEDLVILKYRRRNSEEPVVDVMMLTAKERTLVESEPELLNNPARFRAQLARRLPIEPSPSDRSPVPTKGAD